MSEELMPDKNGRFGVYGGRYVAETLVPALEELSEQYEFIKKDKVKVFRLPVHSKNPLLIFQALSEQHCSFLYIL